MKIQSVPELKRGVAVIAANDERVIYDCFIYEGNGTQTTLKYRCMSREGFEKRFPKVKL